MFSKAFPESHQVDRQSFQLTGRRQSGLYMLGLSLCLVSALLTCSTVVGQTATDDSKAATQDAAKEAQTKLVRSIYETTKTAKRLKTTPLFSRNARPHLQETSPLKTTSTLRP